MTAFALNLTPGTLAANQDTIEPTIDEQIVAMALLSIPRRKIMTTLGVTEFHVRRLTKGLVVDPERKLDVSPSGRADKRCYPIATRPTGIKDYQLRDILYTTHGRTWNTKTGKYEGNYSDDVRDGVKERVIKRARSRGDTAIFLMDWFDPLAPIECNRKIRQCAINVAERVDDAVEEYMEACGVQLAMPEEGLPNEVEAERHYREWRKQRSAAKFHILQLAVRGLGKEPVGVLMERADDQANALAGIPDMPMDFKVKPDDDYYPEPGASAFLDYVEDQGWLSPEWYAHEAEGLAEEVAHLGY